MVFIGSACPTLPWGRGNEFVELDHTPQCHPPAGPGTPDVTRRVAQHILNPRFLSYMSSYDVAIMIANQDPRRPPSSHPTSSHLIQHHLIHVIHVMHVIHAIHAIHVMHVIHAISFRTPVSQ